MSNQLEKLKSSIRKEYAKSFELDLMKSSGFIPVDKRQGEFFVILNKAKMSEKASIEEVIKEKFAGLTPKFIPVEAGDFDNIFEIIDNIGSEAPAVEEIQPNEPSAEEMLVTIGWITQEQLDECLSIAEEKKTAIRCYLKRKRVSDK